VSTSTDYVKKSITIPAPLYEAAAGLVGGGNFSGYVSAALERQIQQDKLAELVADMEAEYGPVSEAEIAERSKDLVW
jgi:hypothetical protein